MTLVVRAIGLASCALGLPRPVVELSIGAVRGNALGGVAEEFLGIPYASARRFAPAVVNSEPLGSRPLDAGAFGPACLQVLTNVTTYGVEHGCHVLNVWRPAAAAAGERLPVLLFVPGGSNDFGEAEPYKCAPPPGPPSSAVTRVSSQRVDARGGPSRGRREHQLPRRAVWLPRVRGGRRRRRPPPQTTTPFPCLDFCSQVGARPTGNWALTDIQAALRFLRREVGAFGGDAARLTLFGQSSGASLCDLHAVLPSSAGLLEGVISQSGGLSASVPEEAVANEVVVARYLGCADNATRKACIANASGDALVYSQKVRCATPNDCDAATSWGPVVDGFLVPDDPAALLARGRVNAGVDVVLGANTNDSYLFIMSRGPVDERAYEASLWDDARQDPAHFRALGRRYPPTRDGGENNRRLGWKASDKMLCGLRRAAASFARAGAAAFLYRYNYWFQSDETCTAVANWHPAAFGSMHQDEVSFVFGQPIKMNIGYTNCSEPGPTFDKSCLGCAFDAREAAFAKKVGAFWTAFAASGDPNVRGATNLHGEWPRIDTGRNVVLEPTEDMTMASEPNVGASNCDLWDTIAASSD